MNTLRRELLGTLVLMYVTAAGVVTPRAALAGADIVSDVPPPPVRVEHAPPRDGYIWAPGHWDWNGHFWAWVSGSYIFDRRPAQWNPDRWEQAGTQWRYVPGHWERQRTQSPSVADRPDQTQTLEGRPRT
jgi:hypothetical protein